MTEPHGETHAEQGVADIAHLGHVELLCPEPEKSLAFFTGVLGMTVTGREGQSAYLHGWRDHDRVTLKLTEAKQAGVGHTALRSASPEALRRRVEALERAGRGIGWIEGDVGHGPAFRFHDPDGHVLEIYFESERYLAPEDRAPALSNQPERHPARGASVQRLDHVNLLSLDVAVSRTFATDELGFLLSELLVLPDGPELGAWLRTTSKSYDLTYTVDPAGIRDRLHHVAFAVETREDVLRAADVFIENDVFIEAGPAKHDIGQTFFVYAYEPSGNRIEVCSGGFLVFAPDFQPVVWTHQDGERGQAWNTVVAETFFTYGTPPA